MIFFLPQEERSVRFPTLLSLSSASWLALCSLELNLTSKGALIYHPRRWGKAKLVLERSFSQRSKKGNYYPFQLTLWLFPANL